MTLRFTPFPLGRGLRVAIALSALVSGVGGVCAIAPPAAQAQTPNGDYPPSFGPEFTEGCLLNAMRAGGLSPETAENYCGCTVNTLQSRYRFSQAIALYEQVGQSNDGRLPEPLEEIALTCLEKALGDRNASPDN